MFRRALMIGAASAAAIGLYACGSDHDNNQSAQDKLTTATPIKHLVVIFNENVSFDHYFATYPNAGNPAGEPSFTPAAGTPTVNGLSGSLLTANPNSRRRLASRRRRRRRIRFPSSARHQRRSEPLLLLPRLPYSALARRPGRP